MLTTPLQLAVMTARIASRGDVRTPRIVKAINGIDIGPDSEIGKIEIDDRYWDYVHKAMEDVVHSGRGTARSINTGLDYRIAGKTGTAQVISIDTDDKYDSSKLEKRQWDHALFVAYAPAENPKIAIGLIVENGEHGGLSAAPIARAVFDAYMQSRAQPTVVSR
jgi:penicillin-binding protein 2